MLVVLVVGPVVVLVVGLVVVLVVGPVVVLIVVLVVGPVVAPVVTFVGAGCVCADFSIAVRTATISCAATPNALANCASDTFAFAASANIVFATDVSPAVHDFVKAANKSCGEDEGAPNNVCKCCAITLSCLVAAAAACSAAILFVYSGDARILFLIVCSSKLR